MVPPRERSASIPCSPLLAAVTKLARHPLSWSGTSLGGVKTIAVGGVAADGQVLDGDAVGVHRDAVEARAAAAVEDDAVAIGAADDDVVLGRSDHHLLAVGAGADPHEVPGLRGVDRGLDRRVLLGDVARRPALAPAAAAEREREHEQHSDAGRVRGTDHVGAPVGTFGCGARDVDDGNRSGASVAPIISFRGQAASACPMALSAREPG